MTQELGPNQKAFIEEPRTTDKKQGRLFLNRPVTGFCCLGIAAELFKSDNTTIAQCTRIDGTSVISYNDSDSLAPRYVVNALALYDLRGSSKYRNRSALVGLNDEGVPFREIADKLEANPEYWFKEPR